MFLAIPVALLALLTAKAERPAASPVASSALVEKCSRAVAAVASYTSTKLDPRCVGWFCALVIVGFSLGYRAHFTYRDSTHRSAMRVQVDHPKLRGVFTTASRAHALDELLQHLKPLVQKDDYLFDHMQLPLIYFLTDTRPYLFTSWPNLYQPPQFQAALKRAESTRAALPVCIMTKIDTCHPGWPDETFPPFQTYRFVENRRTVESFLQEHRYQKIWENNAFEIWKTTETKSGTLASHDSSK
jgi:hypothetical protein